MPSFKEIEELRRKLTSAEWQYWLHHDLLSWRWWLLLAVLVVPWAIWWKLADKRNLFHLVFYGVCISFLVYILNELGYTLQLWAYKYQLFRLLHSLYPIDFSLIVVTHMLVYQYFKSWKTFVAALFVVGAVFSFVGEPFFIWLDIYQPIKWESYYSFPIYIAKAVLVRLFVEGLRKYSARQAKTTSS